MGPANHQKGDAQLRTCASQWALAYTRTTTTAYNTLHSVNTVTHESVNAKQQNDAMAVGAAMGRSAARWLVKPGSFHAAWHGGLAQRPCVPLVDAARLLLAASSPTAALLVESRTLHDLVTHRAGRSYPRAGCPLRRSFPLHRKTPPVEKVVEDWGRLSLATASPTPRRCSGGGDGKTRTGPPQDHRGHNGGRRAQLCGALRCTVAGRTRVCD